MKPSRSRRLATICVAFLGLSMATELGFSVLLGSPTLSVEHPTIEYLFAPNQENTRFGNRIFINKYGMRSESSPQEKAGPNSAYW